MRPDECGADARLPASHRRRHGDVAVIVTPVAPVVKPEDLVTITMPYSTAQIVKSLLTSGRAEGRVVFTLSSDARDKTMTLADALDKARVYSSPSVLQYMMPPYAA